MEGAAGVCVVITDTQRVAMRGGDIVARKDLLKTVKLSHSTQSKFDHTWEWLIAPAPDEHRSRDYVHMVAARIYEHAAADEIAAAPPGPGTAQGPPPEDGLADAEVKT